MPIAIPDWLHRKLWRLGVDVVGTTHWNHPALRRMKLLGDHRVDVVFDVGANAGQYAKELRDLGYRGRIVSFEPLSSAFERLRAAAARDDRWEAVRVAVGERAGRATINVAANSFSSSLLPTLPELERHAPGSRCIGTEEVPMATLESLIANHTTGEERLFVKVDTQGYERRVVESAGSLLSRVIGVQLEMALVPLYDGEALLPDMLQWLGTLGFTPMSLEPGYADLDTGQLLEVDGVLFRLGKKGAA